MNIKQRIDELKEENASLRRSLQGLSNWEKQQKEHTLEIAKRIAKCDSKPIGNIILNMYYGNLVAASCSFCEIFELKEMGCCKEGQRCTNCIDNYLREHYNS